MSTSSDRGGVAPAEPTYFARKATGLVREVSPVSASIFNLMTAAPGLFAAISAFFALSIFPHANVIISMLLTIPISLVVALTFGRLQAAFPRTGGDYVINSRILGPPFGVASTLLNSCGALVGMGFFAYAFVVLGLQPFLGMVATTSHSKTFADAANSLTHQGWQLTAALAFLLVGVIICAVPIRVTMRIQLICTVIASIGFVLGLILLLVTSKGTFISHFDGYAGPGSYHKLVTDGGGADYNTRDTILAIGTIANFTVFQWWSMYFAGEVKAIARRSVATMLVPTFLYFGALLAMIGLIIAKFDHGFLVASNTGSKDYTLAAPPFWTFLATIAGGNTFWAVLFGATFLFWFPLLAIVQLIPPIRTLFALAFDGVLPKAIAKVDSRTHVPVVAVGDRRRAVHRRDDLGDYGGKQLLQRRQLCRVLRALDDGNALDRRDRFSLPAAGTVGREPGRHANWQRADDLTLGALTFVGSVFLLILLGKYRQFGIPSFSHAVLYAIGVIIVGVVLYYVAKAIRAREGISLDLNFQEIPPE